MMGVYLIFQIFFSTEIKTSNLSLSARTVLMVSVFLDGKRQEPDHGTVCHGWSTVPSVELF